jgi:hypothetical protein
MTLKVSRPYLANAAAMFESSLEQAHTGGFSEGRAKGYEEGYAAAWADIARIAAEKTGSAVSSTTAPATAENQPPKTGPGYPIRGIALQRGTVDVAVREIFAQHERTGISTAGIIVRAKERDSRILAASVRNTLRRMRDHDEIHKVGRSWFLKPKAAPALPLAAE